MTYEEKLQAAVVRGSQLMIQHGLSDWRVQLQSKRTVLADTARFQKRIRYSKHFIKIATQEQFDGVTLHEIAHALVGAGHGHDAVFKKKVIEIGGDNMYAQRSVNIQIYKYQLSCPSCEATGGCNRVRSGLCRKCSVPLVISENIANIIAWE